MDKDNYVGNLNEIVVRARTILESAEAGLYVTEKVRNLRNYIRSKAHVAQDQLMECLINAFPDIDELPPWTEPRAPITKLEHESGHDVIRKAISYLEGTIVDLNRQFEDLAETIQLKREHKSLSIWRDFEGDYDMAMRLYLTMWERMEFPPKPAPAPDPEKEREKFENGRVSGLKVWQFRQVLREELNK